MEHSFLEFIPYGRQHINEADIKAVTDVLRSNFITQGPSIPAFEKSVLAQVHAKYAVAVNSATSALHIACLALGVGPGDRVWTSPITFVASANCALYCGAQVDFVDINPLTGLIDIELLTHKLFQAEKNGLLPKVLIPVHLAGASCDMEALALLATRFGFSIIEDASHAIGGKFNNNPVGDCAYSDICVFSFHPVKIITTGEGGMATTNNALFAQKMSQLRSHGITKDSNEFLLKDAAPWAYEQQSLGFNYRMNDLQAALGLSQLKRLDDFVVRRNSIYSLYSELLVDCPVYLLKIPDNVYSSVHLAVIRLSDNSSILHRNVFKAMRARGIGVQLHYSPVHLQPYYRKLGFTQGDFPNAEQYGKNAISLPVFPSLEESHLRRIVQILNDCLLQSTV